MQPRAAAHHPPPSAAVIDIVPSNSDVDDDLCDGAGPSRKTPRQKRSAASRASARLSSTEDAEKIRKGIAAITGRGRVTKYSTKNSASDTLRQRPASVGSSGNKRRYSPQRGCFILILATFACLGFIAIPLWSAFSGSDGVDVRTDGAVGERESQEGGGVRGNALAKELGVRHIVDPKIRGGDENDQPPRPPLDGGDDVVGKDNDNHGDEAIDDNRRRSRPRQLLSEEERAARQEKWEAFHISKKLPTIKDIMFLDSVLGEGAVGVGKYPILNPSKRVAPTNRTATAAANAAVVVGRGGGHVRLRTYDDMIADSLSKEHYVHSKPLTPQSRPLRPCDPNIAPFDDNVAHSRCVLFLRNVLSAAFRVASRDGYTSFEDEYEVRMGREYRWVLRQEEEGGEGEEGGGGGDADDRDSTLFYVSFSPLLPKFEQRTIKYRTAIWNKRRTAMLGAVLKVPQMLFPREPFSEVMAHRLDRLLGVNRVPPLALFPVDVLVLKNISTHRKTQKVHMDPEFLQESRVSNYAEWIEKDLYNFVTQNKGVHTVGPNKTHVFMTAQLFMNEVRPLLETQLIVPYSRSQPGWHRWFQVDYNESHKVNNASLLALSELSIFDFITMNDDRSPNKNNFAIGGCKRCDKRRPSGLPPTILHLDQGMSLWGSGHILSHSPIGKQRDKVKFCIFYKPLMAAIYQRLRRDGDDMDATRQWFWQNAHPAAMKALGKGLLGEVADQMWRVMRRLLVCLRENGHSIDEVLRPNNQFWN